MSEKEPDNPPLEEDEDSGDDDDMGKYMIDDDDEQPEQKHPLEKNELLTSSDLRKVIDLDETEILTVKKIKRVFIGFFVSDFSENGESLKTRYDSI